VIERADSTESSAAATATTATSVARGGIWNTAAAVVPQLYTLAISIVAARVLGPDDMGRQSFIGFVAVVVSIIVAAGFPIAVTRHVAEQLGAGRAEALPDLVRWAWKLAAGGALTAFVGLMLAVVTGMEPTLAWFFAAVLSAGLVLSKVPSSFLIGVQRWREVSTIGLISGFVSTIALVSVLLAGGGISGMLAVQATITLWTLGWTTLRARRRLGELTPTSVPDPEVHRRTVRYALVASIGVPITIVIWFRFEFFFLDRFSADSEIAIYSIAFAAVNALVLIPQMLGTTIAPAFATLFGAGQNRRIRTGYSRSLRVLLLLTLPLTAGALAVGPEFLTVVYGEEYREAGRLLVIMLLLLPLIPLYHVSASLLVGLGLQRVPLIVGAIGAVITILLDLVLISRYDAVGAALGNAGGQLVTTLPIIVYAVLRAGPVDWEKGALVRAGFAAAACGACARLMVVELGGGAAGVAAGFVVGVAVFVLAATALRILPAQDASWLREVAGGRMGRLFGLACRAWSTTPARGRA
jgi:O-antigen/teichoic acid export membrane protein